MDRTNGNTFADFLGDQLCPERFIQPGKRFVGIHVSEDSGYKGGGSLQHVI